jgi:hypothetical protein
MSHSTYVGALRVSRFAGGGTSFRLTDARGKPAQPIEWDLRIPLLFRFREDGDVGRSGLAIMDVPFVFT